MLFINMTRIELLVLNRFFDNELRIINATSNMSGDITCDAQNVLGVDHRTFKLEVIGKFS